MNRRVKRVNLGTYGSVTYFLSYWLIFIIIITIITVIIHLYDNIFIISSRSVLSVIIRNHTEGTMLYCITQHVITDFTLSSSIWLMNLSNGSSLWYVKRGNMNRNGKTKIAKTDIQKFAVGKQASLVQAVSIFVFVASRHLFRIRVVCVSLLLWVTNELYKHAAASDHKQGHGNEYWYVSVKSTGRLTITHQFNFISYFVWNMHVSDVYILVTHKPKENASQWINHHFASICPMTVYTHTCIFFPHRHCVLQNGGLYICYLCSVVKEPNVAHLLKMLGCEWWWYCLLKVLNLLHWPNVWSHRSHRCLWIVMMLYSYFLQR